MTKKNWVYLPGQLGFFWLLFFKKMYSKTTSKNLSVLNWKFFLQSLEVVKTRSILTRWQLQIPMLWFSSSWSMKTWSITKLRSSDWSPVSGLNTKGWRPSLPPVINWWLKIIKRSQSSMKAWNEKEIHH